MWNGAGRRYASDEDAHSNNRAIPQRPAIEDQQQLDAVAALASFSLVGSAPSRASHNGTGTNSANNNRSYLPQPSVAAPATSYPRSGSLGRQYSDANSQNSATSFEYARQTQAPYYRLEDNNGGNSSSSSRAGGGVVYHSAPPTNNSGATSRGNSSYHHAPPPVYADDDYRHHPPTASAMPGGFHHHHRSVHGYQGEQQQQRYAEGDAAVRAENGGPTTTSAAGGYHHHHHHRATLGHAVVVPQVAYPQRPRHDELAIPEVPSARGGPTTTAYGGPSLRPSAASYRDDIVGPGEYRGPSLGGHQHKDSAGGRARSYSSTSSSRYHDDPGDPYGDVSYRRSSASSDHDHHPEAVGASHLPRTQPRYNNGHDNEGDFGDTTRPTYHRPSQLGAYHRGGVEGTEPALDDVVPYHGSALATRPTLETRVTSSESDGRPLHRRSEHGHAMDASSHQVHPRQHHPAPHATRGGFMNEAPQANGGIMPGPRPSSLQPSAAASARAAGANHDAGLGGGRSASSSSESSNRSNTNELDESFPTPTSAAAPSRPDQAMGDSHRTTVPHAQARHDRSIEAPEEEDMEGDDDDYDDDGEMEAEELASRATVAQTPVLPPARGKPEAAARALAAARLDAERQEREDAEMNKEKSRFTAATAAIDPPKKKSSKNAVSPKTFPSKKPSSRKKASLPISSLSSLLTSSSGQREFLLGETVPAITEAEYDNLQELMTQFCRVPLLSEFSRPVSILHPEVR